MFDLLPIELIENILLYLTFAEIYKFFLVFNRNYNIISEHFWKKVCLREDFLQLYDNQEWYECFESGVNKRLGYYVHIKDTPEGILEHVYLRSLIVRSEVKPKTDCESNLYNVYNLDDNNRFNLVQGIAATSVCFKDEFILAQSQAQVTIYKYDWDTNKFVLLKTLAENIYDIFGISGTYCAVFHSSKKQFVIHSLSVKNEKTLILYLPDDVKFVINKMLHLDNIVITTVTFTSGYRIKVYNLKTSNWTLDLGCFTTTGITNDPNVWFGKNFIACCDVSYRLRGIYFGPFKVWNTRGEKLFQTDIEPSSKHYLRCFFKDKYILLTTSDTCIEIFNNFGQNISKFYTKTSFEDIKLSTAYLLFVLIKETHSVEVYDWKVPCQLYQLGLTKECQKSLFSDFLYCPYGGNKEYEVYKFY